MSQDTDSLMRKPGEVPGAPLAPDLSRYLIYVLRRVVALMSADPPGRSAAAREFAVLALLSEQEGLSQQEIGERLDVNRTLMVKLVDRLESAGYVTRTRNPLNRRSYALRLTEQGRDAHRRLGAEVGTFDERIAGILQDAERERLTSLLVALNPGSGPSIAEGGTDYLLSQTFQSLRRRGDDLLAESGLRMRHYAPLSAVAALGPCPQQQLAQYLGITEPAAATTVEELAQAGLVHRGQDPGDRRRYALVLTDAGREKLRELREAMDRLEADLREALGAQGRDDLRSLLLRLVPAAGAEPPSQPAAHRVGPS